MPVIRRTRLLSRIQKAIRRSRITALMGPRQSGKTTLARHFLSPGTLNYFDLENPADHSRLENPMTALEPLRGLVVIDEAQRRPEIFPILRVLADRRPLRARFLILGSASPELSNRSSESLAGRMETIDMEGFDVNEAGAGREDRLWLRGGYPRSFLARTEEESSQWRKDLVLSVIQKDLPMAGFAIPPHTMYRFWSMLANYHGQIWNAAEPARSLGIGESSVRRYLDILHGIFMIRILQPWHQNLGKRQVKSPKIYFRDTGILHHLLGIRSAADLMKNPRCGASWEGFVIEQILTVLRPDDAYFWSTHGGAELDLLMRMGAQRIGIEVKRSDAPRIAPSMKIAFRDLGLKHLFVIYPGQKTYPLERGRVTACNFRTFLAHWKKYIAP